MSVSERAYARYLSGYSKAEICKEFSLTEHGYYEILIAVGSQLYLEMWLLFKGENYE